MSKSQVDQSYKVHHGEDYGAGGGMLPDELVEQQAGGAYDNEGRGGDFEEIFHLNTDYSIFQCYLFPPCRPRSVSGLSRKFPPLNLPLS